MALPKCQSCWQKAVAASRTDKHINIAVLNRFLPARIDAFAKVIVSLFTAAICGLVAWVSFRFVQTSHEYGDILLGSVPAWILQLVLPVGFGLICYRYSLFFVMGLVGLFKPGDSQ